jgi:hypothetical protein
MTNKTTGPDGLTAVLLQLADLTQKLAGLEHRQATDTQQIRAHLATLTRAVEDEKAAVAAHAQALAILTASSAPDAPAGGPTAGTSTEATGYQPPPAPRFWNPGDPGLEEAAGKLRAWVRDVFRPGYGHHAAGLGDCWDQHPLCLYLLDWLSELWAVLYLTPARTASTLAGQAEWSTRLLPAAAEQFARETRGCGHATTRWNTTRPGVRS